MMQEKPIKAISGGLVLLALLAGLVLGIAWLVLAIRGWRRVDDPRERAV